MSDEMVFEDLEPQTKDVYLGKARKHYRLREATEAIIIKWRNINLKGAKLRDGKLVSMEGAASGEPVLVSLCLFEVDGDKEKPVKIDTIMSWRGVIVQDMYKWIAKVSGLAEEQETEELIKKRIESDTEKLNLMKEEKSDSYEEASSKNLPSDGEPTSD